MNSDEVECLESNSTWCRDWSDVIPVPPDAVQWNYPVFIVCAVFVLLFLFFLVILSFWILKKIETKKRVSEAQKNGNADPSPSPV